jgi:hypothetical protein
MNIFWLAFGTDQVKLYCDAHVIKIILEITQMLYAAHHVCDTTLRPELLEAIKDTERPNGYKLTHRGHPMAWWVRRCAHNYMESAKIGLSLCDERKIRYPDAKEHKCRIHLKALLHNPPKGLPSPMWPVPAPICVGDAKYLTRNSSCRSFLANVRWMGEIKFETRKLHCLCCSIVQTVDNNKLAQHGLQYEMECHYPYRLVLPTGELQDVHSDFGKPSIYDIVASYRKYYLECKMNDMPRFTYTNREVPRFVLDAFPRIAWDWMWPVLRLLLLGRLPGSGSVFVGFPMELIGLIERYALSWPYIGQAAIQARLKREAKKRARLSSSSSEGEESEKALSPVPKAKKRRARGLIKAK